MKKIVKVLQQLAWSGWWRVLLECGHKGKVKDPDAKYAECVACKYGS